MEKFKTSDAKFRVLSTIFDLFQHEVSIVCIILQITKKKYIKENKPADLI